MKEILRTFFKTSEERIKNPLISTFILSFIALNWKTFLILFFSSKPIEEKINFITINYNNIWHLLFFPILISIFYILILPYIMWLFDNITLKAIEGRNSNLYKNKLIDIKGKKNIAIEEIELENLKSDYKEKADLNKKIKQLEVFLEEKEQRLQEISHKLVSTNTQISELSQEIEKKEIDINKLIKENETIRILKDDFYNSYKKTPNEVKRNFVKIIPSLKNYFSGELTNESKREIETYLSLGLIELISTEKSQSFKLTDKGLYFLSNFA